MRTDETKGSEDVRVGVVIAHESSELEHFAAEQLCNYLQQLFSIQTSPTHNIPSDAEALLLISRIDLLSATERTRFSQISEQGIFLQYFEPDKDSPLSCPALLIGGGSPRATLWAVYELIQRWGVRYLLHEDILPAPMEFYLPEVNLAVEPILPVRQWRVINDFACGPESWGMADYRVVIDQLAKLKFNRIFIAIWPWQPFLHYEVRGVQRQSATLWFDFHYPITDDMVGRHLFGDEEEFWNPDLPRDAGYQAFRVAGEQLVHNLIDYAHRRGMECVISATLTEFPPEFGPLLTDSQKVHQLAELTVVPGEETDIDDPALTALAKAVLQATVNTYPQVDYVALGMPEFRQWSRLYERAWDALDAKYSLSTETTLDRVIQAATKRAGYAGGVSRAEQEVKGDIVALYFYDRLINEVHALTDTRRPDMKFIYNSVAEELFPILGRLMPRGWETLNFVDYTASRVVKRRDVLQHIPSGDFPCSLIYTLHDDNVGVLPQLATSSLHTLTQDLGRYGWAGFSTRYWLTSDHDPCVAYLARASWEKETTPEAVYRDQISAVCGEAAVDDMLTMFRTVDATTIELETHGLGLTFPVPGMVMKHWNATPMSAELVADKAAYERALSAARDAHEKSQESGCSYVDHWLGRLEFGIAYLQMIAAVRRGAMAEAEGDVAKALRHASDALEIARRALTAYARVARDRSDRGAIALMNEYVYRPLKAKVTELAVD